MNRKKLIITISLLLALVTVLAIVPVHAAADISAIFDADYYTNKYWDLKGMNAEQAKAHFLKYGIKEGRCASASFDVKYYVANNWDLSKMSNEEAVNHYLAYGINENRKTVEDNGFANFDAKHYKANYWDLANMSDSAAYEHYIKYGKAEGRVIPEHVFKGEVAEENIIEEATCVREGRGLAKCTVCGEEFLTVIPKTDHELEEVPGKTTASTCTEHGKKLMSCVNCEYSEYQELELIEHDDSIVVYEKAATCTEAGEKIVECSMCHRRETKEVPPTHTSDVALGKGKDVVPATCTTEGKETVTCKVCGKSFERVIPVIAHNYQLEDTATCTAAGLQTMKCTVCGKVDEDTEVVKSPAKGHSWENYGDTVAATCTTDGYQKQVCTRCGELHTNVLKASHTWVEDVETSSTPCEEGLKVKYTCSVCGATKTETLTGHTYPVNEDGTPAYKNDQAPDCVNGIDGVRVCERCGHEETVKAEHTFLKSNGKIKYEVEASCDKDSETDAKAYCTTCKKIITIPGTAHKAVVTLPTCEDKGSIICADCGRDLSGNSYYNKDENGDTISLTATGHDYANEPFVNANGVKVRYCSQCKKDIVVAQLMGATEAQSEITAMTGAALEGYQHNMNALKSVTKAGNVITIKADEANMAAYASTDTNQGSKKWFAILVDTGIEREFLKTAAGSDYSIEPVDITDSGKFGASDTEIILWLSVEKFESGDVAVKFADTRNESDVAEFTLKLVNEPTPVTPAE